MNLQDLTNQLYQATGYPDPSSDRLDWQLQSYRDALNTAQDELVATCSPKLYSLVRERSVAVVSGTAIYRLNDWDLRLLELRSPDNQYAYKLRQVRSRTADRDGSRNSTLQTSSTFDWEYDLAPRTSQALYSSNYPANSSNYVSDLSIYGASATEGSQTITFGSAVNTANFTPSVVGRMFRVNGESADYMIMTVPTATTITVDRPVRGRLTGLGVTGVGSGYTNAPWEISPTGRLQIRILPSPLASQTLISRTVCLPRKMIYATDTPAIQEEYHHLVWKGALRLLGSFKQNETMIQTWAQEFSAAIAMLQKADCDDEDSETEPHMQLISDTLNRAVPRGTYIRGRGVL